METYLWDIERQERVVVVRLKPQSVPFPREGAGFRVRWEALKGALADAMQVVLFRVPDGYCAPAVVDSFWQRVYDEKPDTRRYSFARALAVRPPASARAHGSVIQTLQLLRSFGGITIASSGGEADFDVMGYILVCRHRICTENTVFVNRTLERTVSPGTGTPWFLSRLLGEEKARQLCFRDASLTAEQAMELRLVHQICDSDSPETQSLETAKRFARYDPGAVASFVRSWDLIHVDLFPYFEQADTGFDVLPPKDELTTAHGRGQLLGLSRINYCLRT